MISRLNVPLLTIKKTIEYTFIRPLNTSVVDNNMRYDKDCISITSSSIQMKSSFCWTDFYTRDIVNTDLTFTCYLISCWLSQNRFNAFYNWWFNTSSYTLTLQRARQLALNLTWRLKQWNLRNRAAAGSKLSRSIGRREPIWRLHHRGLESVVDSSVPQTNDNLGFRPHTRVSYSVTRIFRESSDM